ncbi:hypothetical protein P3102_00830 [Amycolatopsis sp. QT-25]|uniref:hypothetical protein n=1 Tax=Amycolatopsis sp. QT-25 TaxID=3034022 RepID=UPI0023EB630F|nr:hypothetical protein [Amycolatopsis sp. QT-25]WET79836.1 hypothetical protein P3102_00830 [Amycolatopsis sp. QT-25]
MPTRSPPGANGRTADESRRICRRRAPRSATYAVYVERIDTSLSALREVARTAPNAEGRRDYTAAVGAYRPRLDAIAES